MNYNDGRWYVWSGGDCPVHPKSVVEVVGGWDDLQDCVSDTPIKSPHAIHVREVS